MMPRFTPRTYPLFLVIVGSKDEPAMTGAKIIYNNGIQKIRVNPVYSS
jgi:hypothetical protein